MADKATSTVVEHSGFDGVTSEIGVKPASHDIFAKPYYHNHQVQTRWMEIKCNELTDQSGPFRIHIPSNDTEYIDLNRITFVAVLQWLDGDGNVFTKQELAAAPIPNLPNSLFDQVQLYVNNRLVGSLAQNHLNYRSLFCQSLCADNGAFERKKNQRCMFLDSPGLYKNWRRFKIQDEDVPAFSKTAPMPGTGTTEDNDQTWKTYNTAVKAFAEAYRKYKDVQRGYAQNQGFMDRLDFIKDHDKSNFSMKFLSSPDLDFFSTDQLLPPGIDISLVYTRANDKFVCQTLEPTDKFKNSKFKIEQLYYNVPYVTLKPEYKQFHDNAFAKGDVSKRIFKRVNFSSKQIPKGLNDCSWDQVMVGDLPKKIIFFLIETAAYDGTPEKSPYYFPNCDANEVQVYVNHEAIPSNPIRMNFEKGDTAEAYDWFLTNEGFKNSSEKCVISHSHWVNGFTVYSFDLRPDMCNGAHIHKKKTGQLSIKLRLAKALESNHTMLVLSIYDMCATFNRFKEMELHII